MRLNRDAQTQRGGTPKSVEFPADSVLARLAAASYKPTEVDLAELNQVARTGNRAERRAAAKHLKKYGMAAPVATPRAPVVVTESGAIPADEPPAMEAAPQRQATKVPVARHERASGQLAEAEKPRATSKKVAGTKAAAKTSKAKKAAAKKSSTERTPAKAAKKTTAKKSTGKSAAKKSTAQKSTVKKPAKK